MTTENKTANRAARTPMKEQDPRVRVKNFSEVPFGYTEAEAVAEAKRCLQCKKPMCVEGCPVNVKIPEFIRLVAEGKFLEAAPKDQRDERASRHLRQGMPAGNPMRNTSAFSERKARLSPWATLSALPQTTKWRTENSSCLP